MPRIKIYNDENKEELATWYVSAVPRSDEFVAIDGQRYRVLHVIHDRPHVHVIVR